MSIVRKGEQNEITEIIFGENDISTLSLVEDSGIGELFSVILKEFSDEEKLDKGYPFMFDGKKITELPHVKLVFKDIDSLGKFVEFLNKFKANIEMEQAWIAKQLEEEDEKTMKQRVFADLKQAMKDKDSLKKGLLQLVKAGLDSAEKTKGSELTELESVAVIQREIKQIGQSIEGAKKAGREDVIEKENQKISILEKYLPKQLTLDEIIPILCKKGVHQGMNMGDAMKIAKEHLTGKTDNGTIAKAVKGIIS